MPTGGSFYAKADGMVAAGVMAEGVMVCENCTSTAKVWPHLTLPHTQYALRNFLLIFSLERITALSSHTGQIILIDPPGHI
jgi:hypothetical protein